MHQYCNDAANNDQRSAKQHLHEHNICYMHNWCPACMICCLIFVMVILSGTCSKGSCHHCRKRSKRSRSQDDDESYTDDEEISESDSDERRMPSAAAQEASASDVSGQCC